MRPDSAALDYCQRPDLATRAAASRRTGVIVDRDQLAGAAGDHNQQAPYRPACLRGAKPARLSGHFHWRNKMNQQAQLPEQVVEELRSMLKSGEELLQHSAEQAGEEYRRSRAKFETIMANAKRSVVNAEQAAVNRARLATAQADLYVHAHPWQSVGYGAIAAAAVGVLVGLLVARR